MSICQFNIENYSSYHFLQLLLTIFDPSDKSCYYFIPQSRKNYVILYSILMFNCPKGILYQTEELTFIPVEKAVQVKVIKIP